MTPIDNTTQSFELALHTDIPIKLQSHYEASYVGYKRQIIPIEQLYPVYTLSNEKFISNAAKIEFPVCSSGSEVITYISLGNNNRVHSILKLTGSLAIQPNLVPWFAPKALWLNPEDNMLSCQCKLIDNSDQWLNQYPDSTTIPEGYILVDVSELCGKHNKIYKFLKQEKLPTRCTIEWIRKAEFEKYLSQCKKKTRTRLGLIKNVHG